MRGPTSSAPTRVLAARRLNFKVLLVLSMALGASFFSGCASVDASNSSEHKPSPAASRLSVVPANIDFAQVVVGQKNSQTIKLTNITNTAVSVDAVQVSANVFAVSGAKTPLSLSPGQDIKLSVSFAPDNALASGGALLISVADLKAPISVPLSGTGEKSAPALQATPSTINFGSHAVNSSAAQTVTLENTGNVALSISSVKTGSSAYTVSGLASGVKLEPDQRLEFQVSFHPTAKGTATATMTVGSGALPAPVKLALSGTGSSTTPVSPTPPAAAHSVALDWKASSSSISGYHVYRGGSSGGPYTRVSSSSITSLSYLDSSVESGSNYFYVVTAIASDGTESAYSNEVSVDVPNN